MGDFDFAGANNVDDSGGAGAPPLPPPASLPSVSAPSAPVSSPLPTPPAVPPTPDVDPRLQAVLARLQPPAPESPLTGALKKILPIIGAAIAMHQNAGGAFAQSWQEVDKQRQAEASQKASEDLKLATVIHQQEMEKAAEARAKALDKRQADNEARQIAAAARQKALDTYTFLNKQSENPNWTQGVLDVANSDPTNVDKLAIKTPWGESLPLSKVAELGFISQDKDGKFVHKTKKPPRHDTFTDKTGNVWDVMIDPETNQEITRTSLGQKAVPQKFDRYGEPKEGVDPKTGKGTGKFYAFDKADNALVETRSPQVKDGQPMFTTRGVPGAAQDARQRKTAGDVGYDINKALTMIDDAERQLGPFAGRIYGKYLMGEAGSTGSKATDEKLGALRTRILTIMTGAPPAISGTTRSGGATGIMAQFHKVLDSDRMSSSALRGALGDLKDSLDERAGDEAAPQMVGGTYMRDPVTGRLVLSK